MKKRTTAELEALFLAHEKSDLTAAAFCREHDVCAKYFSQRKKQLGWQGEKSAFTEIAIGTQQDSIKLTFRANGVSLYFDALPSSTWLAQFVAQLR